MHRDSLFRRLSKIFQSGRSRVKIKFQYNLRRGLRQRRYYILLLPMTISGRFLRLHDFSTSEGILLCRLESIQGLLVFVINFFVPRVSSSRNENRTCSSLEYHSRLGIKSQIGLYQLPFLARQGTESHSLPPHALAASRFKTAIAITQITNSTKHVWRHSI